MKQIDDKKVHHFWLSWARLKSGLKPQEPFKFLPLQIIIPTRHIMKLCFVCLRHNCSQITTVAIFQASIFQTNHLTSSALFFYTKDAPKIQVTAKNAVDGVYETIFPLLTSRFIFVLSKSKSWRFQRYLPFKNRYRSSDFNERNAIFGHVLDF